MPKSSRPNRRRPMPKSPSFSCLGTLTVPRGGRFPYWRQLVSAAWIDRPRSELATAFRGQMPGRAGYDGAVLANFRGDPPACKFGKPDSDLILLGCIRRGSLEVRNGKETTVMDDNSGLIQFECDRPAITSSTGCDLIYLALPRSAVVAAMGRDPTTPGAPMVRLPDRGLGEILLAQLRAMSEHGGTLDSSESAVAMHAATSLAVTILSRFHQARIEERETLDDILFAAARRYMELNAWQHDLTAKVVVAAVGCSRAHLYRLFALRDQTVAGCLREFRLMRASKLLATEPSQPIGLIAFNSGYTDLSAFGKAFRRRFGMSPSDWRAMAMESTPSPPERQVNGTACWTC